MNIVKFFRKYRWVVNQSRFESMADVPRNTIAHATGKDERSIHIAYESAIIKELIKLNSDINECLETYGKPLAHDGPSKKKTIKLKKKAVQLKI